VYWLVEPAFRELFKQAIAFSGAEAGYRSGQHRAGFDGHQPWHAFGVRVYDIN